MGLAILQAVWNVSLPPATSITTSAPRPSVTDRMNSTGSCSGTRTVSSARPWALAKSRRSSSTSTMTILAGFFARTHIAVQSPVGPAPMMATVSPSETSPMSAAQYPVDSRSPVKSACSSETWSGMWVRPLSA